MAADPQRRVSAMLCGFYALASADLSDFGGSCALSHGITVWTGRAALRLPRFPSNACSPSSKRSGTAAVDSLCLSRFCSTPSPPRGSISRAPPSLHSAPCRTARSGCSQKGRRGRCQGKRLGWCPPRRCDPSKHHTTLAAKLALLARSALAASADIGTEAASLVVTDDPSSNVPRSKKRLFLMRAPSIAY